jgi:hypothetical protein
VGHRERPEVLEKKDSYPYRDSNPGSSNPQPTRCTDYDVFSAVKILTTYLSIKNLHLLFAMTLNPRSNCYVPQTFVTCGWMPRRGNGALVQTLMHLSVFHGISVNAKQVKGITNVR